MSSANASDITIAVMGATGSGKTAFINLASSSGFAVGGGLRSCTNAVQVTEQFKLDDRAVCLIDTPGFDDTSLQDVDILRTIADYLTTSYKEGKTLAGVIYMHRISDFRMSGISRRNFKLFRQLCGDSTLINVVILTNMWGQVDEKVGEMREAELANQDLFFKPALDGGARMLRHNATRDSAHSVLRYIIGNHPLPLQIQQELVDQQKDISQTSAAQALKDELAIEAELKHQEEMRKVQLEIEDAIRAKEEESKRKMEEEARRRQEEVQRLEAEARQAALAIERKRNEDERRAKEAEGKARQEAERAAAEFRRRAEEIQRENERVAQEAARAAAEIKRQIEEQRRKHHSRRRHGVLRHIFGKH